MENSRLLGPVIRAWFQKNEWPQNVGEGWAKATDYPWGPWGSQISICMNENLQPKPTFFIALGEFNRAVSERDIVQITDRRLRDRLKNGEPITHPDGTPYRAHDFFRVYIGDLVPEGYLAEPPVTQDDLDIWIAKWREHFRDAVLELCTTRAEVWALLREDLESTLEPEEQDWIKEILCELHEPQLAEMEQKIMKHKQFRPIVTAFGKLGGDKVENDLEDMRKKLALSCLSA